MTFLKFNHITRNENDLWTPGLICFVPIENELCFVVMPSLPAPPPSIHIDSIVQNQLHMTNILLTSIEYNQNIIKPVMINSQ